jgi:hypothetical protein
LAIDHLGKLYPGVKWLSGTGLLESLIARGHRVALVSIAIAFAHKFVIFAAIGLLARGLVATVFLSRTFAALKSAPVFSATILLTGMSATLEFRPTFTLTKLSSWRSAAFKFPTVLTATRLLVRIFSTFEFPAVPLAPIFALWTTISIALVVCAATIVMSGCTHC